MKTSQLIEILKSEIERVGDREIKDIKVYYPPKSFDSDYDRISDIRYVKKNGEDNPGGFVKLSLEEGF